MKEENTKNNDKPFIKWLKRIGVAGFLFFLLKGMIWLLVIFGAGAWIKSC